MSPSPVCMTQAPSASPVPPPGLLLRGGGGFQPPPPPAAHGGAESVEAPKALKKIFDWPKVRKMGSLALSVSLEGSQHPNFTYAHNMTRSRPA